MSDWSFGSPVPSAPAPRRGRGPIITGVVLLVVALVMGVAGTVVVARSATTLIDGFGATYDTPASFTTNLDAGTSYTVYELSQLKSSVSGEYLPTVVASEISVSAPGGYDVPVLEPQAFDGTFDDGSGTFVPVGTFDAPTSGDYDIAVTTEGATVAVAPGFGTLARTGVGALVVGLAVLLGIIGLVLLVIGVVQRSRKPAPVTAYGANPYAQPGYGAAPYASPGANPPAYGAPQPHPVVPPQPVAPPAPAALPPAGWYADPQRPGGQRYWDGTGWTDHLA